MKIPRMTAERAIGPAFGSYATRAPGYQQPALAPMVFRAANVPVPAVNLPFLRQQKTGLQPSPCPGGQIACWGADGTAQELDYECCQAHEGCYIDQNGDPACRIGGAALKALHDSPLWGLGQGSPLGQIVRDINS